MMETTTPDLLTLVSKRRKLSGKVCEALKDVDPSQTQAAELVRQIAAIDAQIVGARSQVKA